MCTGLSYKSPCSVLGCRQVSVQLPVVNHAWWASRQLPGCNVTDLSDALFQMLASTPQYEYIRILRFVNKKCILPQNRNT